MTTTTNDFANVATNLFRNLGNGKDAAKNLNLLISEMENTNDGNRLASLLFRIRKEKNDTQAFRVIKGTILAIFVGAKFSEDKMGRLTLKTKDSVLDPDARARLSDAVKRGLSLRDTLLKEVQGEKKNETVIPAQIKKQAHGIAKDMTKADLLVLIAALREEAKGMK